MTPARFRQIEELYHAAREATAGDRATMLALTDPELRSELESLLATRTGHVFLDAFWLLENAAGNCGFHGHDNDRRCLSSGHTASSASSARAAWAKSFGPSTRD